MRELYAGLSDYQVAEKMSSNDPTNVGVVVRYKSHSRSIEYDQFGTAADEEDLQNYFNSPYCHDVEIFYVNPKVPFNKIPHRMAITDDAPNDSWVMGLKRSR